MTGSWLVALHAATGVYLVGYLGVHLWEMAAAVDGRWAFVQRLIGARVPGLAIPVEIGFVLLPLLVHAGTGVAIATRVRRHTPAGRYPSDGARRLQWASGVFVLGFLVVHVVQTWGAKLVGVAPLGLYEELRTRAGTPLQTAIWVVGATAVCLHVGQGLRAFAARWTERDAAPRARAVRVAVVVLSVVMGALVLNTLSHFATGRALWRY